MGNILCLTMELPKKPVILQWKSHSRPPPHSSRCSCEMMPQSSGETRSSPRLTAAFILAVWRYVPIAAMISRCIGNVDFSVCSFKLAISLAVCFSECSKNELYSPNTGKYNHSWAFSQQQASHREHSRTGWLIVPRTARMQRNFCHRDHCELEREDFCDLN